MINEDLQEEQDSGWVLSEDKNGLVKVDYDTIPLGKLFAILVKTGKYTIMEKTANFDDAVHRISEDYPNTLAFLQRNSNE